ncbi:hypothetical protein QFC24_000723 [Naganishia onofrii]|uniref:Uncharacterized protein n=1 Tax=Naganishia onofrii TaxID=1851511 RepID=A0ACC2XWB9_9TREE|nr:hypothetical protein QFC24_000723 [Naganishia onofrii]
MAISHPAPTNESFFLYGVEKTGFEVAEKPRITSDDAVIVQIKKTGKNTDDVVNLDVTQWEKTCPPPST